MTPEGEGHPRSQPAPDPGPLLRWAAPCPQGLRQPQPLLPGRPCPRVLASPLPPPAGQAPWTEGGVCRLPSDWADVQGGAGAWGRGRGSSRGLCARPRRRGTRNSNVDPEGGSAQPGPWASARCPWGPSGGPAVSPPRKEKISASTEAQPSQGVSARAIQGAGKSPEGFESRNWSALYSNVFVCHPGDFLQKCRFPSSF